VKKAAFQSGGFFMLKQRNDHRSKAYPNPLQLRAAHYANLQGETLRYPTPEKKSNTTKKSLDT
jgi:hypothetical protein